MSDTDEKLLLKDIHALDNNILISNDLSNNKKLNISKEEQNKFDQNQLNNNNNIIHKNKFETNYVNTTFVNPDLENKFKAAKYKTLLLKKSLADLSNDLIESYRKLNQDCCNDTKTFIHALIVILKNQLIHGNTNLIDFCINLTSVIQSSDFLHTNYESLLSLIDTAITNESIISSENAERFSYWNVSNFQRAEILTEKQIQIVEALKSINVQADLKYIAVATGTKEWIDLAKYWNRATLSLRMVTISTADTRWLAFSNLYLQAPSDLRWVSVYYKDPRWLYFFKTWPYIPIEIRLHAISCGDFNCLRSALYEGALFDFTDYSVLERKFLIPIELRNKLSTNILNRCVNCPIHCDESNEKLAYDTYSKDSKELQKLINEFLEICKVGNNNDEYSKMNAEYQKLTVILNNIKTNMKQLESENLKLSNELINLKKENINKDNEMMKLSENCKSIDNKLKTVIDEYEQKLNKERDKYNSLVQANIDLNKELEQYKSIPLKIATVDKSLSTSDLYAVTQPKVPENKAITIEPELLHKTLEIKELTNAKNTAQLVKTKIESDYNSNMDNNKKSNTSFFNEKEAGTKLILNKTIPKLKAPMLFSSKLTASVPEKQLESKVLSKKNDNNISKVVSSELSNKMKATKSTQELQATNNDNELKASTATTKDIGSKDALNNGSKANVSFKKTELIKKPVLYKPKLLSKIIDLPALPTVDQLQSIAAGTSIYYHKTLQTDD